MVLQIHLCHELNFFCSKKRGKLSGLYAVPLVFFLLIFSSQAKALVSLVLLMLKLIFIGARFPSMLVFLEAKTQLFYSRYIAGLAVSLPNFSPRFCVL